MPVFLLAVFPASPSGPGSQPEDPIKDGAGIYVVRGEIVTFRFARTAPEWSICCAVKLWNEEARAREGGVALSRRCRMTRTIACGGRSRCHGYHRYWVSRHWKFICGLAPFLSTWSYYHKRDCCKSLLSVMECSQK
ncbi:hypothetical protein J6590_005418 [Homalodisca vitripennis]|nr:hypothetical protein J6590_005418 [Homalodisca vitripennis]